MELCLADAIHMHFKWVKIIQIWQNGGQRFWNIVQTERLTDSFIPPIYNTIWWGRLLLIHKHMSLSKEPPYNNDKQWITLYIKYTYRPVMWVRKLLNVTYWTGRSGKWLCYLLKTVQTLDRNEWCTDDEMRLNIYNRNTIKNKKRVTYLILTCSRKVVPWVKVIRFIYIL